MADQSMVEMNGALIRGLPAHLASELRHLRAGHSALLRAAAAGDSSRLQEMRRLSRCLGRLLAREARRPAAERSASMVELAIAVDRLFPELRALSNLHTQALLQRRLQASRRPALPSGRLQ